MSEITTTAAYLIVNSVGDIVARTANATPSVLVDLDEDGAVVGIEAIGRAIGVDELLDAIRWLRAPAPTSPSEPATLRFKTSYQVPGLDGTWRIRAMETTNMASDGKATLLIVREDVVSAPLIGADDAVTPQHVTGVTELEPVPSTPRVWAMPRDVRKLSDRHGVIWQWAGGPYFTTGEDQGWEETIETLMTQRWPLTEVEETNDAD